MAFPSRKETHDSNTPPDLSSRTSMNEAQYRRSSNRTLRSYSRGSIANSSVHTTSTAATRKDLFDSPEQNPSPGGAPRISHLKSFHSLEKATFRYRNQSQSTVGTIRGAGSVRSHTATSTSEQEIRSLNTPSFEGEDGSPLPSETTPRSSLYGPSPTLPEPSPSSSRIYGVTPSTPLYDLSTKPYSDSRPFATTEMPTADNPPANHPSFPLPTDRRMSTATNYKVYDTSPSATLSRRAFKVFDYVDYERPPRKTEVYGTSSNNPFVPSTQAHPPSSRNASNPFRSQQKATPFEPPTPPHPFQTNRVNLADFYADLDSTAVLSAAPTAPLDGLPEVSFSPALADSLSDQEKRRQEAINEIIYTERDFVRDMEYLRDVWIAPLSTQDILPEARRADFIEQVFWNILDIIAVNTRLREALNRRQKSYPVIEGVADIFLEIVPHFAPFVSYGSHQLYGKYEFEKEKSSNPAFAQFVEETERRPDSRKLELNAYLTKPTTRLARYPLLLDAVLKQTPDESPDKQDIPKVAGLVREFLAEVNRETGRAENKFNLLQLEQQLLFRPGEQVDLRLREEGREMIYKGLLKRRGGTQGDSGELLVFLLDHALLMVKQKNKAKEYKVYRRPIPLEFLLVIATDEFGMRPVITSRPQRNNSGVNGSHSHQPYPPVVPVKLEGGSKTGFAITFVHLGRNSHQITLWAASHANHRKWIENVTRQQDLMRDRSHFFEMDKLSEGFFQAMNHANCAVPFSGGQKVAYGTFDGVYFQDLREPDREPIKVLALTDVAQVDVLDEYGLLIVLSEGQVITFPLDALEAMDPLAGLKRAKRIATHTSFFKSGVCVGRTFVCVVKTSPLSSTITIFEPIDQNVRGRNSPTFRKLLQGGNDTLRIYKGFYIPVQSSSIHFLRTKLCVACVNGFEIIDPDTLDTQGLLDPSDESLDFVRRRGDNTRPKPMAIYRIENEFLLCYDEFAFYINRFGRRSRKNFLVHWEGSPTSFASQYPYVLAFEPTFVEIRNVETGSMSQVIQGNNLRCLYEQSPVQMYPSQTPYGRATGREIILVSDDRVLTLRMAALPGQ